MLGSILLTVIVVPVGLGLVGDQLRFGVFHGSIVQLSRSFQLVQSGNSSVKLKGILIEVSGLRPPLTRPSGGGDEDLLGVKHDTASLGLDSCSPLGYNGEEY